MGFDKCASFGDAPFLGLPPLNFSSKAHEKAHLEKQERAITTDCAVERDVDIDMREVCFLILQFLSAGPCQRTCELFWDELLEHHLLPRRYHAWYSRSGEDNRNGDDNDISFPLSFNDLVNRIIQIWPITETSFQLLSQYLPTPHLSTIPTAPQASKFWEPAHSKYPHIEKDHLVKLLKQLILSATPPLQGKVEGNAPTAADVPTLLGSSTFALLKCDRDEANNQVKPQQSYLRWPHMQADQVRGLGLREIGGGFTKHHRAPSIRSACYAIAKPLTMVQKMQNIKKLRGHRNAVYCAIFDRSGRYVITGSDDRLVKIWSMDTSFCLASCRGHEGDITDLAVTSNNDMVASASNDFIIRVWRLPDGFPVSVLRGHTGAVTAIAFSPRPTSLYQLLSSSDDGTCRIWDVRFPECSPRVYMPKPLDAVAGKSTGASSNGPSSIIDPQSHQILCCAYNANGTVFVTGSSDTYARVWSACKLKTDELDQPVHEMDVLRGHENDVNYVQFSGCAGASKSSVSDATKDDKFPKFKNSWFCHDNIVTCSRDGSAIIWIPRSRRSHGKIGRWTKAYHLKVPPPPMPPQPPRGGPRQRLLPTPRGVNMIVWSLDNRFVLAAIMDCRICVWNAADGSLVHSLAGHDASTYVLDVHPFNPRIAMSAGYDGKTIVWDIWEGKPVRVYEIGRFKLVDGKFSPDGASIVLSDDVGQIYLLSTGQGESQKDAKYDQFFLGDYRPLLRDIHGNALDQETQLTPFKRNIEDLLCDSSMIPYPEPYQTMYQQRRLGALKIEWRQSSRQFAVGPDISLGQEYQLLPLADLDRMIEPLPEFLDAMYWEPENEVISDDADSEYNVTEENYSGNEQGSLGGGSSSDPECSAEESGAEDDEEDGLRRSRRNKQKAKVEQMTSSGRRVKKRMLDERDGTLSGGSRTKKLRNGFKASKKKSSKAKSSRPQRAAARNARNMFSQLTGTSTNGEDEDGSEEDTSDSESVETDANNPSRKSYRNLHAMGQKYPSGEPPTLDTFKETVKPPNLLESQANVGSRRLVFKLSIPDSKKPRPLENTSPRFDDLSNLGYTSSKPLQESNKGNGTSLRSEDPWSSTVDAIDAELSQNLSRRQHEKVDFDHMGTSADDKEVKLCMSKGLRSEDVMPSEVSAKSNANYDSKENTNKQSPHFPGMEISGITTLRRGCTDEVQFGTRELQDLSFAGNVERQSPSELGTNHPLELNEAPPHKSTKLRIKMKNPLRDPRSPSKLKLITAVENSTNTEICEDGVDGYMGKDVSNVSNYSHGLGIDLPESSSNAVRRTRSMVMKATSRKESVVNIRFKVGEGRDMVGTSRNAESNSMRAGDENLSEEWMSNSKGSARLRSARSNKDLTSTARRKSNYPVIKSSWVMLTEPEENYRYIPQLGDAVVYLRQGHEEYMESTNSSQKNPWKSVKSAVEVCTVEHLNYAHAPSGESCCKITLRFVDPNSSVFGKAYELTLAEAINFPDFVVEKTRYDDAIARNWTPKDKCQVWWRNENGDGGRWWEGKIVSSEAKSPNFPESPWERYGIEYEDDHTNIYKSSPWELHDLEDPWEHPHIDSESTDKLISLFTRLEQSGNYGIQAFNQAAEKLDYLNRCAAPLYPEVIKLRLEHNYYRRLEAVEHDLTVMLSNAQTYFLKNPELLSKIRRLSERFRKTLSKL